MSEKTMLIDRLHNSISELNVLEDALANKDVFPSGEDACILLRRIIEDLEDEVDKLA